MSGSRHSGLHGAQKSSVLQIPTRADFDVTDVKTLWTALRLLELRGLTVVDPNRLPEYDEAAAAGDDLLALSLLFNRPAILVRSGTFDVPVKGEWSERLRSAKDDLDRILLSVGRVEPADGAERNGGTAWRLGERHVITAGHAVKEMERRGDHMVVDFVEEHSRDPDVEIVVSDVKANADLDVAALELAPADAALPRALELSSRPPRVGQAVAIIGFPSNNDEKNPLPLIHDMFADILDVKRLQPGFVTRVEERVFSHDCSTLDGNSGGPVIDLDTGEVVGVHLCAHYRVQGSALRSDVLLQQARRWGIVPRSSRARPRPRR